MYYELNKKNHSFKALAGYAQIYHFNTAITAQRQQFYNNNVPALDFRMGLEVVLRKIELRFQRQISF
ncbi:MAG: hypothetical protein WDO15_25595 [Bacteroidota bacterium]